MSFTSFDEWDQVALPDDYAAAADGARRWIDGWAIAIVVVGLTTGGAALWLPWRPAVAASDAGGSSHSGHSG